MKTLLTLFLFLLLATWLGHLIHQDPGYVLISYQHTSIETSVWVAFLCLLLSMVVSYVIIRLLTQTLEILPKIRYFSKRRHIKKAMTLLHQGLVELVQGDFLKAQKNLDQSLRYKPKQLVAYLAAAYIAQNHLQDAKRDAYLTKAYQHQPKDYLAIGLFQAQLQIEHEQWEEALANLKNLHEKNPKNPKILALLRQVLFQQEDWHALQQLLPSLKKYRAVNLLTYQQSEWMVYTAQLKKAAKLDAEALTSCWDTFPKEWQHNTHLIAHYAEALIALHELELCRKVLENALKKHWDVSLLPWYVKTATPNSSLQLVTAEKWLKTHQEPELLLCLHELCLLARLYAKAERYLSTYQSQKPF